jgi:hypothetical protein
MKRSARSSRSISRASSRGAATRRPSNRRWTTCWRRAPRPLPAVPRPHRQTERIAAQRSASCSIRAARCACAYGALLPLYANDPTLVPEILAVAREHPRNANGIYNALVVLTHMNAASLRPHRAEIVAFAEEAQRTGPRVAERARTLIRRVPS